MYVSYASDAAFKDHLCIYKKGLFNFSAGNKIEHFVTIDDKVRLQLPKPTFSNYPLLRTIHDATNIVLEEAKILKEMEKLKGQPQIDIQKDSIPCMRTCTEICYYGV